MTDPRTNEEKMQRMDELMRPIDTQLMMCDDVRDQLMMASCMMVTSRDLFIQHIGQEGAKEMFKTFYEENFNE
jgi:hypothetical protein